MGMNDLTKSSSESSLFLKTEFLLTLPLFRKVYFISEQIGMMCERRGA
jgi:hypothetical protein